MTTPYVIEAIPILACPTHNTNLANPDQTDTFSNMSTQLKGSASRLGRMAASGNKVAIFKLSAIIIGCFMVLYYTYKLFFRSA